ncbi:MAG: YjbQ family protein [Syntrophaceae bacterium]|nr:YjbQ family protein [Syntrophaceae bacterium]
MEEIKVQTTSKSEIIDITSLVQNHIKKEKISKGICVVFVPHTTAGVTINENADPDVTRDILASLERAVPFNANYRHAEGNSAAHVKASLVGSSQLILIENGRLLLGTWQSIFFCEFDGPRARKMLVSVIANQ